MDIAIDSMLIRSHFEKVVHFDKERVYSTKKDTGYFKVSLTQDPEGHLQEVVQQKKKEMVFSTW